MSERPPEEQRPRGDESLPERGPEEEPRPATYAGRMAKEGSEPPERKQREPRDGGDTGDAADTGEATDATEPGDTVEADVLALGDAEEKAEEGDRAGEQGEAEGEGTVEREAEAGAEVEPSAEEPEPTVEEPEPTAEEPEPTAEEPEPTAEEPEPTVEEPPEPAPEEAPAPTAVAPAAGVAAPPPAAVGAAEPEEPPKQGLWLRFLAASLIIVISMASATAVSLIIYFTDIAKGLGGIEGVENQLTKVEGGDPQTVLLLGSDVRPGDESARSDTTMLLRLDPDRDAIALLSLPRDLKVNIPGYGVDRLNAAYAFGGPKLTLEVVKQLTGLEINHVVNVDFTGFAKAVNSIECVFVDVDRRYFHSNVGLSAEQQYAEIDIEAGYQQLCGFKALQYVRYRHTDNDLVRAARQQDFLREAKAKIGFSRLWGDRQELIDIFKDYTTSDVDDGITVLEVFKSFLAVHSAPVKEVHFQGDIGGPNASYVTASNEQIQAAVTQFLGLEGTSGPRGKPPKRKKDGEGDKEEKKEKKDEGPPMIDASAGAQQYGSQFAQELKLPILAPTRLVPGSFYDDDSRLYEIITFDGDKYPSYKLVFQTDVGEFYGVMGTTWGKPPILEHPNESREIGDRSYNLFYDGDRLRMIAWKTKDGAYWISNTLLQTLSEEQMIAIAQSIREF